MSTLDKKIAHVRTLLEHIAQDYSPATLASSLAAEDMVLTDILVQANLPISIFTLETGRLHLETLALIERARTHWGVELTCYRPDQNAVAAYVNAHGEDAFYESVELRKACCVIRKVEPLARALQEKKAWITGQRRAQSVTRGNLAEQEDDPAHGMQKFNPLADWSEEDVWAYVRLHNIPYNPLHDQGYPSIGCAPCTRAIKPDEDVRAGRWWWELANSKECGLHMVGGKFVRSKQIANE